MGRGAVVDAYFLEHRAKVVDIAAFLDRVERARGDGACDGGEDFRVAALRAAIGVLVDGKAERARRVLEVLSDPTVDPAASAAQQGAVGAYEGAAGARGPQAGRA